MTALAEIHERLEAVTEYHPAPHRAVVNTAGDRWGVLDSGGSVVTSDVPGTAKFYAAAPRDIAALLQAVEAGLAACDRVIDNADGHKPPGPPHPTQQQATALRIRAALAEALGGAE